MTVFISYVREDEEVIDALVNSLSDLGIQTWMDRSDLEAARAWRDEIREQIEEKARLFAVLVSDYSNAAPESIYHEEIRLAALRQRRIGPRGSFMIPLLVDKATLVHAELKELQAIGVARDDPDSIKSAAREIKRILASQPPARGQAAADPIMATAQYMLSQIPPHPAHGEVPLLAQISQRVDSISDSIAKTAEANAEVIEEVVDLFSQWMLNGAVVRVLGAGRARLAGAIPASRLAHGGARVYVQDDIVPMPHTIRRGGIIAVSASGLSRSVLGVLQEVKDKDRNQAIRIVGIADKAARQFRSLCHLFIGIESSDLDNPLEALADSNEYVCSMLLDAIVVAAGHRAGFDDTTWRLGHENVGSTGPYDLGER